MEGGPGCIVGSTGREVHPSFFQTMATINHTVDQLITDDSWTAFEGLERLAFRIVLPDWHEPFPINGTRELEGFGLYKVSRAWYINGPVMDQFNISMGLGPINVPAGTQIISAELPDKWEANRREASAGKKKWYAYTNGRTTFC